MLIDTHCHLNIVAKDTFDTPLNGAQIAAAGRIMQDARHAGVSTVINVGTSLIESQNCILLAQQLPHMFAAVGIHPNDLTPSWKQDLKELEKTLSQKEKNKIVAIGECGLDFHYPNYNLQQQKDAFKAQIELALKYDLALIVHTRDAAEQTLHSLEEYAGQITKGIIHCFSEDRSFAAQVISWHFAIGLGGTITYPRNHELRAVAQETSLEHIVLETDSPFLPPQSMRGQKNLPAYIALTAQYLATLRNSSLEDIATGTTETARRIFALP